ncbi:MAG: hypothetical protein WDN06_19710 [Asticcacaulis sp.]
MTKTHLKRLATTTVTALSLVGGAMLLTSCETNEALGRSQLILVDDSTLEQSALQGWPQQLQTAKVSHDPALNAPHRESWRSYCRRRRHE